MIVTDESAERLADPAVHRLLIAACDARGIARPVVLNLLDRGEGWPASMPTIPPHVLERAEAERSRDYATSDMARRARRQRTARALLWIVGEQARCADLAAAAETLAKLLAADGR